IATSVPLPIATPMSAAAKIAAALAVLFAGSAIPFLILAWRVDRPVWVVALPMIAVRGVALAAGSVAGILAVVTKGQRPGPAEGHGASGLGGDEHDGARR
ncbi:MAG: hypothetical protein ACE5EL_07600, partial [Anaerolineae bacterium]